MRNAPFRRAAGGSGRSAGRSDRWVAVGTVEDRSPVTAQVSVRPLGGPAADRVVEVRRTAEQPDRELLADRHAQFMNRPHA